MPIRLIQTISEQNLPNLWAALALRPSSCLHLTTATMGERGKYLRQAMAQATPDTQVRECLLRDHSQQSVRERVQADIVQARQDGFTPVVNITGGTKLMSIGAFAAAFAEKCPALYVDAATGKFIDCAGPGLSALLPSGLEFGEWARNLNADWIVLANCGESLGPGRPWEPFAELAAHLATHPTEEKATHQALFGPKGLLPSGQEPRPPDHRQWLQVVETFFPLPETVARLASAQGFVRRKPTGCHLRCPGREILEKLPAGYLDGSAKQEYQEAIAPVQQAISFLTGGWIEVETLRRAHASGLFRDLRWSVRSGSAPEPDLADREFDLVGLLGPELALFSCKRGSHRHRLLAHLDELRAAAERLGGSQSRRFLVLKDPLRAGADSDRLRPVARVNRIRLLHLSDPQWSWSDSPRPTGDAAPRKVGSADEFRNLL